MVQNTTLKLEVPVPFKLNANRIHFLILGGGGNGSHLIHNLTRIVKVHQDRGMGEFLITIADADIVEEKNITRQNFFLPDRGKAKVDVLANRYSRSHGLSIGTIREFIEDERSLIKAMDVRGFFPVVISCVDNHKTRKVVYEVFKKYPEKFLWIDCGNAEFTGQVNVGFNTARKLNEGESQAGMFKLPCVIEVFPEILNSNDLFKSEESCDDLGVKNNDQNIATNVLVATEVFVMINQLLNDGLSTYMVKLNAKTGEVFAKKTTYSNLKQY